MCGRPESFPIIWAGMSFPSVLLSEKSRERGKGQVFTGEQAAQCFPIAERRKGKVFHPLAPGLRGAGAAGSRQGLSLG